jgi:predicted O-methyltransferase YrrM
MIQRVKRALSVRLENVIERALRKRLEESLQSHAKQIQHAVERSVKRESLNLYRQVASYLDLRAELGYESPIPPLRGYPISPDLAVHILESLEDLQPRRILEVGSGFSTVLLARYCAANGATMVSIDHEEDYLEHTRKLVEKWGLGDSVEFTHCPIVNHELSGGSYTYYSKEPISQKESGYDFVLVDGPPKSINETVRGGLLPVFGDLLAPQCRIIMDDYARPGEKKVVEQWVNGGYARLVMANKDLEKHAVHVEVQK